MRPLEYEFPHQGLASVTDQFMLGSGLLVAPVVEPRATTRSVQLPPGKWEDVDGGGHDGEQTITVDVDLSSLPRFRRLAR